MERSPLLKVVKMGTYPTDRKMLKDQLDENKKLNDEIKRLKGIIAKELSENDELGYEYTYVIVLKDEINVLKKKINKLKRLVLLTDEDLSTCEVGELSLKQWSSYLKDFPEDKQFININGRCYIYSRYIGNECEGTLKVFTIEQSDECKPYNFNAQYEKNQDGLSLCVISEGCEYYE